MPLPTLIASTGINNSASFTSSTLIAGGSFTESPKNFKVLSLTSASKTFSVGTRGKIVFSSSLEKKCAFFMLNAASTTSPGLSDKEP